MASVHVSSVVVEMPPDQLLARGQASPREVRPQSDPCIARIVELVGRRGRLLPPTTDSAAPKNRLSRVLRGEAPLPLESWWPDNLAPSRRDDPPPPSQA